MEECLNHRCEDLDKDRSKLNQLINRVKDLEDENSLSKTLIASRAEKVCHCTKEVPIVSVGEGTADSP